ncbi:MAG: hypothetical protein ABL921_34765, partial [Pirellula sp.]
HRKRRNVPAVRPNSPPVRNSVRNAERKLKDKVGLIRDNQIAVEEYKVHMILRRSIFVLNAATALLLLLALSAFALPQQEPLVAEWVQKDVDATKLVGQLVRERPIEPAAIARIINGRNYHELEDLGFGAGKIEESQGFGYSTIHLSALVFRGSIVRYRITFQSWSSWPRIRAKILNASETNVPKPYTEIADGLKIEINDGYALESYKKAVATELGEMEEIHVPPHLREDYEYLISPFVNSTVGVNGCGVAGMLPQGKESVDLLQKAEKRIELLENVLRGYNPGGRVFSLIALRQLRSRGIKFSRRTEVTMDKLLTSNLSIDACFGGTIHRLTAKQIVDRVERTEK